MRERGGLPIPGLPLNSNSCSAEIFSYGITMDWRTWLSLERGLEHGPSDILVCVSADRAMLLDVHESCTPFCLTPRRLLSARIKFVSDGPHARAHVVEQMSSQSWIHPLVKLSEYTSPPNAMRKNVKLRLTGNDRICMTVKPTDVALE